MRVGELSRRSGVTVASIKYYLREGLLPPGERTGPNQASYGEDHVRRLRLIRALIDVGHLSVAGTRDVLAAVDDEDVDLHDVLGVAQMAITPAPEPTDDEAHARAEELLDDLVARRGWDVHPKNPGRRAAVDVVATWEQLGSLAGLVGLESLLDGYVGAMETLAEHEVASALESGDREQSVEGAVIGIVLGGSLLAALRGMAQENASARRLR